MQIFKGQPGHTAGLPVNNTVVTMRCPACSRNGTFDPIQANDVRVVNQNLVFGVRRCPDPDCSAIIFFVDKNGKRAASYPSERISFDSVEVPEAVKDALNEAISCHAAGCDVAAALMIRKTLELVCVERGATGANLKARLIALGKQATIPEDLFAALDHLRLLGNDAAHVDSQAFNHVGVNEVEIGIEFAKELLKSIYQYKNLLARLLSLKKMP